MAYDVDYDFEFDEDEFGTAMMPKGVKWRGTSACSPTASTSRRETTAPKTAATLSMSRAS